MSICWSFWMRFSKNGENNLSGVRTIMQPGAGTKKMSETVDGRLKKNIRNILQDFRGIKKPLSLAIQ